MADNENADGSKSDETVQIPGYDSFSSFIAEGYKVMMEGVKASGSLPTGRNYQFYQTYTNFREKMSEKYQELQSVMEDILRNEGVKGNMRDVMMEDALDTMINLNDKMLDRAAKYMDVMEGIKTGLSELVQEKEISGSWNRPKKNDKVKNFTLNIKKNIPRPQFTFKDKVDNSNTVWEPKIKDKPNAIKPLAILVEKNDDGDECFSHPYEYELELFEVPDSQLIPVKNPKKPSSLEQTTYEFVEKEEQLEKLIEYLNKQTEFAVDLEHHSYRSFLGFTCLMQISTKEKDFIIDALSLRHCLHQLNTVFTKPTILKIFHGADQDILWLQRDFGVYVVNMFDTHQAARMLNFPKLSLAFLLNFYCKVDANKHFQLFDWRTRPLPDQALKYAREDTHYLIYISEIMRNQLIEKANGDINILKVVYHHSKQVCLKKFEKLVVDEESYMNVYRKGKRFFDNRQLFALKALYLWRDKTARELDESLAYVLPDSMMLNIAENLPREVQGILACCNPVPPLVKANLLELHYLLVKAKEQPLVKVVPEGTESQVNTQKAAGVSAEQHLLEQWYYPSGEIRDDLPTLLGDDDDSVNRDTEAESESDYYPTLSIFNNNALLNTSDDSQSEVDTCILDQLKGLNFVSPYQRYVKVLPYSAQIEKEMKEQEAKDAEDHRERSRKQQALAMEIKTLQESGLIKLKKEDEEVESLKLQLIQERKRRANDPDRTNLNKRLRRLAARNAAEHLASDSILTPPNSQDIDTTKPEMQAELRGVKPEVKDEEDSSVSMPSKYSSPVCKTSSDKMKQEPHNQPPSILEVPDSDLPSDQCNMPRRPMNWKELRQQKQQSGKPFKAFDYSQVNYDEKFSSGTRDKNQAQTKSQTKHQPLDKKRKWINNVGAKKFNSKKRKRAKVV